MVLPAEVMTAHILSMAWSTATAARVEKVRRSWGEVEAEEGWRCSTALLPGCCWGGKAREAGRGGRALVKAATVAVRAVDTAPAAAAVAAEEAVAVEAGRGGASAAAAAAASTAATAASGAVG